jgi:ABC-type glutathione transport system ATPase component
MIDPGAKLDPENLSSGEKQLLLLFFNVLTSAETASLFIIDEPEISLNVKWQRKLVDSLIDITTESSCQFLLATHSIELLTKHRNETIKLTSH